MKELFFACPEPLRQDVGRSTTMMVLTTADYLLAAARETKLVKANLRVQSLNNTVVKVLDGLKDSPEQFLLRSGAFKFTCSDIRYDGDKGGVFVSVEENGGISDGGGRTAAIGEADRIGVDISQVSVFIQFVSGLDDQGQTEVCIAANTNRKVPIYSLLNKQSLFEPVKTMWGAKLPYTVYYEGQHAHTISFGHSEASSTNVTHLVKLLVSVSDTYDPTRGKHPVSATRAGAMSAGGMPEASIKYRLHLLGDLYDIWLYGMEQIHAYLERYGWENKHGRPRVPSSKPSSRSSVKKTHFCHTKETWDGFISPRTPFPVVAACRVFLHENRWTVSRQWLLQEAVPALWKQYQAVLLKNTETQRYTNIEAAMSSEGVWSSLTTKAMELRVQRLESAARGKPSQGQLIR